jgi:hypothetical protein
LLRSSSAHHRWIRKDTRERLRRTGTGNNARDCWRCRNRGPLAD